jgi:TolA-binding protein
MKDKDRLPEDLSVLARRDELSPAEARRFEVYVSASPVSAWLHRLGCDYDALQTSAPGDAALLERAIEKAHALRTPARARRTRFRAGTVAITLLAGSASAALAAVGVERFILSSDVASDSHTRGVEAPGGHTPSASRPVVPPSDAPQAIPTATAEVPKRAEDPAPRASEPIAEGTLERRTDVVARQSAPEMFSLANQLRKAGRTSEAIAAYRKLQTESPESPEASVSHVLLARILTRHEGPAAGLVEFERYLARNPRGSLAEEALSGSAAALRALGRSADERRVLMTLLSQFPSSIYARAARERLDELD